jgi:hypothetical protein
MSPRSQQRQYSDAQRALMNYQRDYMSQQIAMANTNAQQHKRQASSSHKDPTSPRLMPLAGSPGPVTPLELEDESYLTAGSGTTNPAERAEYVERIIREQVDRMRSGSVSPGQVPSNPVSPIGSY